jgi:hypothetical protein
MPLKVAVPYLLKLFSHRLARTPYIGICRIFCTVGARTVMNLRLSWPASMGMDEDIKIRIIRKMGGMNDDKVFILF